MSFPSQQSLSSTFSLYWRDACGVTMILPTTQVLGLLIFISWSLVVQYFHTMMLLQPIMVYCRCCAMMGVGLDGYYRHARHACELSVVTPHTPRHMLVARGQLLFLEIWWFCMIWFSYRELPLPGAPISASFRHDYRGILFLVQVMTTQRRAAASRAHIPPIDFHFSMNDRGMDCVWIAFSILHVKYEFLYAISFAAEGIAFDSLMASSLFKPSFFISSYGEKLMSYYLCASFLDWLRFRFGDFM